MFAWCLALHFPALPHVFDIWHLPLQTTGLIYCCVEPHQIAYLLPMRGVICEGFIHTSEAQAAQLWNRVQ